MSKVSRREFVKSTMIMGVAITAFPAIAGPKIPAAEDAGKSPALLLPPFLGRPTRSSVVMNLVGGEQAFFCRVRYGNNKSTEKDNWQQTKDLLIESISPKEVMLENLSAETEYWYKIYARLKEHSEFQFVTEGSFKTQSSSSSPFSFALFSDSHITPFDKDRFEILSDVSASILARRPEFTIMLGDNIQTFTSHGGPMINKQFGPALYAALRQSLGRLPSKAPLFKVLGNWEGENGWHPERERAWARQARMSFIPNPGPETYLEGGSKHGDYYGFTWGDALFLVLNVTGYTYPDHSMNSLIGKPNDWTLGKDQANWLYKNLSRSRAKWKFLFIHHTVGGNAGDNVNSCYGRGGGRAANTGEQVQIHNWMKRFRVQALFYGHDHVFTDIPVDGIHYICVGSAGAPWKFDRTITGYDTYWTPSGYTWVDIRGDKAKIFFVKPDTLTPEGKVLHSFEIPQSL